MERDGYKLNYFHDGKTAWVKTGVTVVFPDGRELEHTDYLPIMDNRNNSLPLDKVNSWEVNKTIQRSLTKAVARHGVGLYIYAGEDLPEEVKTSNAAGKPEKTSGAPTLKELIKKIAELFARLKANNGDTAIYNEIVTKVTGDASFRCNAATDTDYDKVAAIYKELLAVVNK
ncbi:MAG: DUF1071 domain-containing protein [Erysipelotrichaceae bacterium]|nr:DUF1071 domain-containing protein [Erysipelotrichaceae bacterium]